MKRGINPLSIKDLNFESQYLPVTLKAGIITGILAMAVKTLSAIPRLLSLISNSPFLCRRGKIENKYEILILQHTLMQEGIAIGRSFAILENYQTDGNKEMIAFGMMNIVGSLTSCYLTTGTF